MNLNDTITTIPLSGNQNAGIGYIMIPDDPEIDRDQFVEDCYRSNKVCISGEPIHSTFYNVSIDKELIKSIVFPTEVGKKGSPVVWVNIVPYNKPIIIAVLAYENEYYLNGENQLNISRNSTDYSIDSSINANDGTVNLNLTGDRGKLKIVLNSPNKNSEMEVYIKGKAKIHATEELKIVSDNKLILQVVDEDSQDKLLIKYERGQGFSYVDEFGNKITCSNGEMKQESTLIKHNSGSQPMVLGDSLETILQDLITAISALTVTCNAPATPSSPPINLAQFQAIVPRLQTIKSTKSKLD